MTQSPISDSQRAPRLAKSKTGPRIRKKDGHTSTGISSIRKPISVADLSPDAADLFSSLDLPPLQGSDGEEDLMTMIAPSAQIHPGTLRAANETAPPSSRPASRPDSRPSISDHQSLSFPRASRSLHAADAASLTGSGVPRSVGGSNRPEVAPPALSSHGQSMSGVSQPGLARPSFAAPAYPYAQAPQQQYNSAQYSSHGISNPGVSSHGHHSSYPPAAYPMPQQQPAHLQQPQPMVIPQNTQRSQAKSSGGAWTGLFVVAGVAVAVAAGLLYTRQTDVASRKQAVATQAPQADWNDNAPLATQPLVAEAALAPQAPAQLPLAAAPSLPVAQPAPVPQVLLQPGTVQVQQPPYAQQQTIQPQNVQPQNVQPQNVQPQPARVQSVAQPVVQQPRPVYHAAARPAPRPAAAPASKPQADSKQPDPAAVARALLIDPL